MSEKDLVYEKRILIRSEQVDMTRHMRISELFRLMEEASIAHTEELGCTRDRTLDRGLLWVITRQEAEIDELPAYDEKIIVRSWQGDMMHVFFPRFYEFERDGKIIARGRALWMLIEEETRQMVMPEDYDIFIPGRPGSEDMMPAPVSIPAGAAESGPVISQDLVTRFSQVDINGHMNNTRYFDMIDDALYAFCADDMGCDPAEDPRGCQHAGWRVPRMIRANYLSELRGGDRFTLDAYRDEEDRMYFEGADRDKVRFRIAYEY